MNDNSSQIAGQINNTGNVVATAVQGKRNQERAQKYTKELMGIQQQNAHANALKSQQLGIQTWKDTSYPAQMEQMKKAGLNPALMYKGSGAGGTLSQPAVQAGGGSTPGMPENLKLESPMAMAQISLIGAQKANIEADTRNKEAKGTETQQTNKTYKETGATAEQYENENRQSDASQKYNALYRSNDEKEKDGGYKPQSKNEEQLINENDITRIEAELAKETKEDVKQQVIQNLVNARLDSELGKGRWEHMHIHALLWCENISGEKVREKWIWGKTWSNDEIANGYTSQKTLNYYVKYVTKIDEKHPNYKPRILNSNGIGKRYVTEGRIINKYNKKGTNEYIKLKDGRKTNMPIYFRNKIYTDEEKEKLWLEKLDKNQRYVNGIKTENDENYIKVRKVARTDNTKLGYGKREKQTTIQDENYKRQLLLMERMKNHE